MRQYNKLLVTSDIAVCILHTYHTVFCRRVSLINLGHPFYFPTSLPSFHVLPFISFHSYPSIPGTFVIAYSLKFFKCARFFPTRVRSLLSDFSVFIAILLMTAANVALDLDTERLHVPTEFEVCILVLECNCLSMRGAD